MVAALQGFLAVGDSEVRLRQPMSAEAPFDQSQVHHAGHLANLPPSKAKAKCLRRSLKVGRKSHHRNTIFILRLRFYIRCGLYFIWFYRASYFISYSDGIN